MQLEEDHNPGALLVVIYIFFYLLIKSVIDWFTKSQLRAVFLQKKSTMNIHGATYRTWFPELFKIIS